MSEQSLEIAIKAHDYATAEVRKAMKGMRKEAEETARDKARLDTIIFNATHNAHERELRETTLYFEKLRAEYEGDAEMRVRINEATSARIDEINKRHQKENAGVPGMPFIAGAGVANMAIRASSAGFQVADVVGRFDLAQQRGDVAEMMQMQGDLSQATSEFGLMMPFLGESIKKAMSAFLDTKGIREAAAEVDRLTQAVDKMGERISKALSAEESTLAKALGGGSMEAMLGQMASRSGSRDAEIEAAQQQAAALRAQAGRAQQAADESSIFAPDWIVKARKETAAALNKEAAEAERTAAQMELAIKREQAAEEVAIDRARLAHEEEFAEQVRAIQRKSAKSVTPDQVDAEMAAVLGKYGDIDARRAALESRLKARAQERVENVFGGKPPPENITQETLDTVKARELALAKEGMGYDEQMQELERQEQEKAQLQIEYANLRYEAQIEQANKEAAAIQAAQRKMTDYAMSEGERRVEAIRREGDAVIEELRKVGMAEEVIQQAAAERDRRMAEERTLQQERARKEAEIPAERAHAREVALQEALLRAAGRNADAQVLAVRERMRRMRNEIASAETDAGSRARQLGMVSALEDVEMQRRGGRNAPRETASMESRYLRWTPGMETGSQAAPMDPQALKLLQQIADTLGTKARDGVSLEFVNVN